MYSYRAEALGRREANGFYVRSKSLAEFRLLCVKVEQSWRICLRKMCDLLRDRNESVEYKEEKLIRQIHCMDAGRKSILYFCCNYVTHKKI